MAKTKALISCAVTAQLICLFVFAYAKNRFSHNEAHLVTSVINNTESSTRILTFVVKREDLGNAIIL